MQREISYSLRNEKNPNDMGKSKVKMEKNWMPNYIHNIFPSSYDCRFFTILV